MKILFSLILIIVSAVSAAAQQSDSSQSSDTAWDTVPATLAGQGFRRTPLDERASANYVTGGIGITQMYTDNIELSTSSQLSDLSYDIEPHIALNYLTPRLSYDAAVTAGFLINRTLTDRNQATQNGALDFSYHLSQFWVLRLNDSFRNTTGLWSGTGSAGISSISAGLGPVQQPNPSLFTFGRFRENTALAELSAQFSPMSYGGIRGEQTHMWFPSDAADPVVGTLYGGDTYSAEVFYNHHFSTRNWGGITARAQRFDLNQSLGRTDTGTLLFMYAVNIRPTMTLSFFGGPQLSVTSAAAAITAAPAFQRRLWSPNGGAAFNSETRTTSGSLSFTHGVSDGGGLISAVTLTSADAQILRRIVRRFQIGPGFTYAESMPIVPGDKVRTYSGRVQSTLRLKDCSFSTGYSRDDRSAVGSNATAAANSIWVSFSYDFIRPIGR
jgi:hypothetical protein